jgi:radical SAM protein with 4Fe4S-binding SPASM domain
MFAFDGANKETYERIRVNAQYEKVVENIRNLLNKKVKSNKKIFTIIQCIYMNETNKEIKAFYRLWNMPGVDTIRIRQITYGGDKMGEQFVNKRRFYPCYWPWINPLIKWNGEVTPCCQDANCDYSLGNIKDKSLVEIWNNEKMQRLRKLLIENKYHDIPICRDCNMFQPSIFQVLGSTFWDFYSLAKMVPFIESIICKLRYNF